ncbi:MAG: hypothetical protein GY711_31460 [bacterium]|nr:hypothetical protein [bacterium]
MRSATLWSCLGLGCAGILAATIHWPAVDAGRGAAPRERARVLGESAPVTPAGSTEGMETSQPRGAEPGGWESRERELLQTIDDLRTTLAQERDLREAREKEWFEFTMAISSLPVEQTPEAPEFLAIEEDEEAQLADADERSAAEAGAREEQLAESRARQILMNLRALTVAEQVRALDFLEIGRVHDGATGPIVVRLLDDWGRPMGTMAAERLRLEVSRAGRTVTLIFEEGFESHGGVATPFGPPSRPNSKRGGVRRIDLPGVDPGPWIEAFPELIDPEAEEPVVDDGKWDRALVRMRLNDLLRTDTTSGHWRLRALGGVVAGVLRDVHLVQLSDAGRITRRVFADHMRIEKHEKGILMRLEEGVQERAGRTAPFLEGRYRVYLPRARAEDWVAAGLPGLAPAPEAPTDD